jgi:S1-C subfamily serine protease
MTTNLPQPELPPEGYGAPHYGPGPYFGYPLPPPAAPKPSRARRGVRLAGLAALVAGALVAGVAVGHASSDTVAGSGSNTQLLPTVPGNGGGLFPGNGNQPNGRNGTSTSVSVATAEQSKGVVTIVSVLKYQNAQSAGTGMILSSNGEVLTNNHVISGATSITVTDESTDRSYRADVVGTAPSQDVAILKLRNASGLTTAKIGDSSDVKVGDQIVGVGNAGGTGTLRAAKGTVTDLNQSITATDERGQAGERLSGLIQVNAPIISGDSGGPLYDASGEIVGMNTAASASSATATAYAIPIDKAKDIASQIESGRESSEIHIGLPAFLGVSVEDASQGALVQGLLDGGPAADAGITPGSVITAVGGRQISSADTLKSALADYDPGQRTKISWTDPSGAPHSATVTLGTGPAD